MLPARAVQAIFAIIVLGLIAYGTSISIARSHSPWGNSMLTWNSNQCLRRRRLWIQLRRTQLHALHVRVDAVGRDAIPRSVAGIRTADRTSLRHRGHGGRHDDFLVCSLYRPGGAAAPAGSMSQFAV